LGCPEATATPTEEGDTPTTTCRLGTATATATRLPARRLRRSPGGGGTPTPTATAEPTTGAPLGDNICTLAPGSALSLQTSALTIPLAPTGSYSIDCGTPDENGVASCTCELIEFDALVIPGIGDVCVNPAQGCAPGRIDCNGGAALDVELKADHNITTCTDSADCLFVRLYCVGRASPARAMAARATAWAAATMRRSARHRVPRRPCPAASRSPTSRVQLRLRGSNLGDPSVAGGLNCNLGTQINVELPSNGHCGDPPPSTGSGLRWGEQRDSTGIVLDASNEPGPSRRGRRSSTVSRSAARTSGPQPHRPEAVGQLGFFDSSLGDIRSGNTFFCQ
jgi:hypothetical protein